MSQLTLTSDSRFQTYRLTGNQANDHHDLVNEWDAQTQDYGRRGTKTHEIHGENLDWKKNKKQKHENMKVSLQIPSNV